MQDETRTLRQRGVTITTMDTNKQTRLEVLGFKVGTTQKFLGLTDEETAIVELRLALSTAIRRRRKQRPLPGRLREHESRPS